MTIRRILHLVGSPTDNFFCELSTLYASGCIEALWDPARYTFIIAYVTPDGLWRFPAALDPHAIAAAPPRNLGQALAFLANERIDAALPQMFCSVGMTHYRALLELLEIPYLGNQPAQMALTVDKALTKTIVAAAGVPVPQGQLLRRGDAATRAPPSIVKPNHSDNSEGVTLVTAVQGYAAALEDAFAYGDTVIVEDYIELGREVRCGLITQGGDLVCLPLEEYAVDEVARPIRTRADKLKRGAGNDLIFAAKSAAESWIVDLDDPIHQRIWPLARRCHDALGCRQYSLFDFRIDREGNPWFLEAGLYCAYSPKSVLAAMAAAMGVPIQAFFAQSLAQLIGHDTGGTSSPPSYR